MELEIGNLYMPVNAATKTFAVLAKRGAGKSYTAAVLAEEFAKAGVPFVVFDPIDVWWGLRLDADGKKPGLPVVVFGGEHGDIKLDRDMGRDIARAVVKEGVSCVISTFGMPKVAMRQLIADFAEELLNINNTPRHVFIEEAHEFVPQRVMGAMAKTFSAVEALVVMGRNRGIGVTLINQRAATVNKDVLTQLDTLLVFRNTSPQDRKALKEWAETHDDEDDVTFKNFIGSLPSLPTGEGWVWSPEFMGMFQRIKVRKRRTFHPDREKMGAKFTFGSIERSDIASFIANFKVIPKETQSKKGGASKKQGKTEVTIYGPGSGGSVPEVPKHDPIKMIHESEMRELRNQFESQIISKDTEIRRLQGIISAGLQALQGGAVPIVTIHNGEGVSVGMESNKILAKLGGMPRSIYERLLQHPNGLTKRQIALMCGYAVTGGSFRNAVSKLATMGLIRRDGDMLQALLK